MNQLSNCRKYPVGNTRDDSKIPDAPAWCTNR